MLVVAMVGVVGGFCLRDDRLALVGMGVGKEATPSAAPFCDNLHRVAKSCVTGEVLSRNFISYKEQVEEEKKEAIKAFEQEKKFFNEKLEEVSKMFEGKEAEEASSEHRNAFGILKTLMSKVPTYMAQIEKGTSCISTELDLVAKVVCTLTSTSATKFISAENDKIEFSVQSDVAEKMFFGCKVEINLICSFQRMMEILWVLGKLSQAPSTAPACVQRRALSFAKKQSSHAKLLIARIFTGMFVPNRVVLIPRRVPTTSEPSRLAFSVKPSGASLEALSPQP